MSTGGFKDWAEKYLPLSSRARELIMEMDDSMPRWMAVGQIDIITKIVKMNSRHHRTGPVKVSPPSFVRYCRSLKHSNRNAQPIARFRSAGT